jgi:hypothetical protein
MARVSSDYNLAVIHPEIAELWHPALNGHFSPHNVAPSSSKSRWWLCQRGHEWEETVSNRAHFRTGCPYCSGQRVSADNCLDRVVPHLAKEWHPTKNGNLLPKDVTPGSQKRVSWLCSKGHEWATAVNTRSQGSGCPYCAGKRACKDNCLETLYPRIAKEWHPHKNGDLIPSDVTRGSDRKVWWLCNAGHEWESRIKDRTANSSCPACRKERRRSRRRHAPELSNTIGIDKLGRRRGRIVDLRAW